MRELLDGPMCSITCSGVMPRCKVMILALFSRVTSEKSLKPTIAPKHPLKIVDAASNPMVVPRSRIFHSPPDFFRCYSEYVPRLSIHASNPTPVGAHPYFAVWREKLVIPLRMRLRLSSERGQETSSRDINQGRFTTSQKNGPPPHGSGPPLLGKNPCSTRPELRSLQQDLLLPHPYRTPLSRLQRES